MRRQLWVIALAGAAAACNGPAGGDPTSDASPTPTSTASAGATPASTPSAEATGNGARSVAEETDDFLFEYAYPAEAGRIPKLRALLDRWLDERRQELGVESVEARREARGEGFPYNKHSYTAEWKVIADLPDWLSLSVDIATYTGGAHGNYHTESLVWDKKAGKAMDAIRLFTSPDALEDALGERFCDALNAQREERRDEPVEPDSDDSFDQCPGIDELEVLVGSSNRRTFNRLTVYAGPYVAGPYVEGEYEVDLPVDARILAAVKPEYRAAFTARN